MTALTTARLHRLLRGTDLVVFEHVGHAYATDARMLWRVDEQSTTAELLDEFNLPVEPMRCQVTRRSVRRMGPPPDPAKIRALLAAPPPGPPMVRYTIGGYPAQAAIAGYVCDLWRRADRLLVPVQQHRANVLDLLAPEGEWRQEPSNRMAALARHDADGSTVALLMPVMSKTDLLADDALEVAA